MKNDIGGTLQGISLYAFLQMAQMEQITCTLSVVFRGKKGTLFLQNGFLISAEAEGLSPLDSALHIISWEKSGNGPYRNKVSKAIKNLSSQIEATDFEEMKREAMSQGPERISTYLAFFEKHPNSSHREDILKLISDMEEEYFIFLQHRFLANETPDRIAETIELGQQFLDTYLGSEHTEVINRMIDNCRSKLLPTPEELSALYQKNQSFPSAPEEWYWSSKNEKRYVGQ